MKHIILFLFAVILSAKSFSQPQPEEVTSKNSWLKVGLNGGIPFGDLSDISSFILGIELKGQLMSTKHLGIGITTGYNHFFPENGYDNFGTIPLGGFLRYYPKSTGFFAGVDLGYSFLIGVSGATGGVYTRPQLGYHNYNWNVFVFYNGIFRNQDDAGNLQYVGIGATRNIRFR
ncbi:hypothetical protein SAMN05518672_106209 [Chitinophaga sp. CF118]|uniref:hypothetical protein n=1 Tax=Chitinophaga sp. CF118 TaxID=1884367 RepID=UPI0008E5C376|nr:hypothetical protein [Chitinophaga sp. CF118]SFE46292.1 hypothetical protein SAMN05518672_106209 [Chitinophaga sp. CF118]